MSDVKLTSSEQQARMMLVHPLDDMPSRKALVARVEELSDYVGLFKIGLGSFTRFGPAIIEEVSFAENNVRVVLDLKLHDIPNTVADAVSGAVEHGVYAMTLHASGGAEMMRAAALAAEKANERHGGVPPKLLGVTVLTSHDERSYLETFQPLNPALANVRFGRYEGMKNDEPTQGEFQDLLLMLGLDDVIEQQVLHLARLAQTAGLSGIVCSPKDLPSIKSRLRENFFYMTPGIGAPYAPARAEQKRVMTPYDAVVAGSSLLVVGNAISGGKDPSERQERAYLVVKDMARALEARRS